jgi:hypothetical protein
MMVNTNRLKENHQIVYEKFKLSDENDYNDNSQEIKPILTPFGIVPIVDVEQAKKDMKIWVVNTNFDINTEIVNKINIIEGIEALKPLTRYKLAIGIGRLFDDTLVKSKISSEVYNILKKYDKKGNQF